MKKIFKYPLFPSQSQNFNMPKGAKILSVGEQDGNMFVWAIVDSNISSEMAWHWFYIFVTGHIFDLYELNINTTFIGTVQMSDGLVWHVFDGGET